MAKDKICGVYCIKNLTNNKKYIGSSIDIYGRWQSHKNDLKNNNHHSRHLQKSYNYYGEENFIYYILEQCDKNILIQREQYWIDKYNTSNKKYGYNISPIAGAGYFCGATYEDLKNNKYSISLDQFNKITYLLQTSSCSIGEISRVTNVNIDMVYSIYYKKTYKQLTEKMNFIKRRNDCQYNWNSVITELQAKEIIHLLINGYTILNISEITGVSSSIISDIKIKHSWSNLTKDITFPHVKPEHPNKRKKVVQYDLNMNYIQTFDSITLAASAVNGATANISKCCKGERKTAYGFIWMYEKQF